MKLTSSAVVAATAAFLINQNNLFCHSSKLSLRKFKTVAVGDEETKEASKNRSDSLEVVGKDSDLLETSRIHVVENTEQISQNITSKASVTGEDDWISHENELKESEKDQENQEMPDEYTQDKANQFETSSISNKSDLVDYKEEEYFLEESYDRFETVEHYDEYYAEEDHYEEDGERAYNRKLVSSSQRRRLATPTHFTSNRLTGHCNEFVFKQKCESFRSFLENNVDADKEMVVVPCGVCFRVDIYDGRTLELPHGLNIIGMLQFSRESNVVIRTKAVIVQGVLRAVPLTYKGSDIPIPFDQRQVKIVLYGDQEMSFVPDGINSGACGINEETKNPMPCNMGVKPFFVAGGRMLVSAIDDSCPTYAKLVDVMTSAAGQPVGLILSDPMAAKCWGEGAQIVLASDTIYAADFQTATVKHVDKDSGVITINKPLKHVPTTEKKNPLYAVEVHLDERNFIIESEPSGTIGGHFIVYHTPGVKQMIKGIAFRKMGQQGLMGRYPIHFHMSEDCPGSVISRNLIKESFQRCVVIHGTHHVTIEHNVAFNHFGHCFMTEDGGEYHNKFMYNLGHYTRKMPGSKRVSEDASDQNPSTFWWTNPKNTFIGNIAAGSESHGIWFELHGSVRAPSKFLAINNRVVPRSLPLETCRDNVAHSNRKHGLTTYKTGWNPSKQAVIENQVSFRNGFSGIFLHKTSKVKVLGGHFADNLEGVRILQATGIAVDGATFVALSKSYRATVRERGQSLWSACRRNLDYLAGVTWSPTQAPFTGPSVVNSKFEEYDNTACRAFALEAERAFLEGKIQTASVSFGNLTFSSPANRVSVARAMRKSAENIAVEDFDGSISGTGKPGFLVQNDQATLQLIDTPCRSVGPGSFMQHCPGSCLRNLIVETPGTPNLDTVSMVVTTADGREVSVPRGLRGDGMTIHKNGRYGLYIPTGGVSISFEDKRGNAVWPGHVTSRLEREPRCEHGQTLGKIKWIMPPADRPACDELIYNGDFESNSVSGWQSGRCDIKVLNGGAGGSRYGLRTDKKRQTSVIRQVLDRSCLVKSGLQDYVIKGSFRLVSGKGKDMICNLDADVDASEGCPGVYLYSGKSRMTAFHIETKYRDGEWTDFSYTVTLPPQFEKNQIVHMDVAGANSINFYLDNFSMRKASYGGNRFVPFSASGIYATDMTRLEENRDAFDKLLSASPNKIVKRYCAGCHNSHVTIFYRRWSNHAGVPLLDYFENNFRELNNKLNIDFSLYSTYEDAVDDKNRWTHCTFIGGQGFPGGCGPNKEISGQFNAYKSASRNKKSDVVFSVEQ